MISENQSSNWSLAKPFPVQIAAGTDLNHLQQPDKLRFSSEIFNDLPDILKNACHLIEDQNDKEVFLFGALGVISGIFPNISGSYSNEPYESNLFCYLIAPFGAGKGFIKMARILAEPIHDEMRAKSKANWEAYEQILDSNKKSKKQQAIAKPKKNALFIPANNSKSGLIELMHDNDGRGILFETEGDTLVDALRQDHGGFSDVLRKVFHHESIAMNRRTLDEFLELSHPKLSVVLSSTFDQYKKLIPNIENGLFSRFIHYQIRHNSEFKDVFDPTQDQIIPYLKTLSARFHEQFKYLETRKDRPILFQLSDEHKKRFVQQFDALKKELAEYISSDMAGVVNRLGLISFRLNMIFTIVRHMDKGNLPETLVGNETDFKNAFRMIEVFHRNAIHLFDILTQNKETEPLRMWENELAEKAEKITLARNLLQQGLSYAEIGQEVFGDDNHKSTIWRWINK